MSIDSDSYDQKIEESHFYDIFNGKFRKIIESSQMSFSRSDDLFFDDLKAIFNHREVSIIKLKMDGYKNIEIAKKLKCCPATITKHMVEIKNTLREMVRNGSI